MKKLILGLFFITSFVNAQTFTGDIDRMPSVGPQYGLSVVNYSIAQITQTEVPLQKPCPYGYLEYLPACETITENCKVEYRCPRALLINLDGWGPRGNGTTDLFKVASEGIARLIRDGVWDRKEFIVISPQLGALSNMYSPRTLHAFIAQMIFKYDIDPNQIFMVGLSGGANSIYAYILAYDDVKAVVCISGAGAYKQAYKSIGTRLWAFHGAADRTVYPQSDISFYKNYNLSADSIQATHSRLTIWEGVSHTGWQEVYSGKWIGRESLRDAFKENIFDWLLME